MVVLVVTTMQNVGLKSSSTFSNFSKLSEYLHCTLRNVHVHIVEGRLGIAAVGKRNIANANALLIHFDHRLVGFDFKVINF